MSIADTGADTGADAGCIPHLHIKAQFTRNAAVKEELEHNNQSEGGADGKSRSING
jgi:hypothetical protein